MRSIVFVNQHYGPDVAATGQHLTDLAEHLAGRGYAIEVLCARGRYQAGRLSDGAQETRNGVAIRRLWTPGLGRSSHAGRALEYLCFILRVLPSLLLGRRPRVVFLTTPPLLPVLGRLIRSLRGLRYGVWSMDLHPEAEIAAGMFAKGSPLARILGHASDAAYRDADFVVALGPFMHARIERKGVRGDSVHTVPIWSGEREVAPVAREANPLARKLGLGGRFVVAYSGNAGLAHEFEPILEAARRLRDRDDFLFLFIGDGPRRPWIEAFAERHHLWNLRYLDYFPREQLALSISLADVHMVSLRPPFAGVSVPAKLYGIMAAARPVLFVGPHASETGTAVRESDCGAVVDPERDPAPSETIARILLRWRDDPDLRRSMGERGRRTFLQRYERGVCCAEFERVLRTHWFSDAHARSGKRPGVAPVPGRRVGCDHALRRRSRSGVDGGGDDG